MIAGAPQPPAGKTGLPQVPGRLEGEAARAPGAAEGGRRGAPEQFLEPRPRVGHPESGQPLPRSGHHDGLVLGACQVQADDHIITPKAASIVRHMGPSFVSGWTREGITRTGRRCRLPLSHTLILESGWLCQHEEGHDGGSRRRSEDTSYKRVDVGMTQEEATALKEVRRLEGELADRKAELQKTIEMIEKLEDRL